MRHKIVELMQVPPKEHDIPWLQKSLQAAIELELSTIPPYLCGLWSIDVEPSRTVTNLIRGIVMEEMLHLGIACNLLVALKGSPQIFSGYKQEIKYPGPLPGGVHPGLTVYLAGLTQEYVRKVYMQIELPEHPLAISETFATIGAFYDAVTEAFRANHPPLQQTGQLTVTFESIHMSLDVMATVDAAVQGIAIIKEQGEGTSTSMGGSPFTPDFGNGKELAHYYKFGEIASGKTIKQQPDGKWDFTGAPVTFPINPHKMLPIPSGGYQNPVPAAKQGLADFNATFTQLLQGLDAAWGSAGSNDLLQEAIAIMFALKPKAQKLFAIPLPGGNGVYGPDFVV